MLQSNAWETQEQTVTSSRGKEKQSSLLLLSQWLALSGFKLLQHFTLDLSATSKRDFDFLLRIITQRCVCVSAFYQQTSYLFSSIQIFVKEMETANVKINFGVWLLDRQENAERFWQILSVHTSYSLVPLSQSVQEGHGGRLGVRWVTDRIEEARRIWTREIRKCDESASVGTFTSRHHTVLGPNGWCFLAPCDS